MADGSLANAVLYAHMALVLGNAIANSSCVVYTNDARMKLAEKRYLYPDVSLACEEQAGTLLTNPVVVIEILSPTTEKHDRGAKFNGYIAIPSLQEYVLIGSESPLIEVHRRDGNFWRP